MEILNEGSELSGCATVVNYFKMVIFKNISEILFFHKIQEGKN